MRRIVLIALLGLLCVSGCKSVTTEVSLAPNVHGHLVPTYKLTIKE